MALSFVQIEYHTWVQHTLAPSLPTFLSFIFSNTLLPLCTSISTASSVRKPSLQNVKSSLLPFSVPRTPHRDPIPDLREDLRLLLPSRHRDTHCRTQNPLLHLGAQRPNAPGHSPRLQVHPHRNATSVLLDHSGRHLRLQRDTVRHPLLILDTRAHPHPQGLALVVADVGASARAATTGHRRRQRHPTVGNGLLCLPDPGRKGRRPAPGRQDLAAWRPPSRPHQDPLATRGHSVRRRDSAPCSLCWGFCFGGMLTYFLSFSLFLFLSFFPSPSLSHFQPAPAPPLSLNPFLSINPTFPSSFSTPFFLSSY